MLSKQDREKLYRKAAGNCGVNIIDSTPAFFYGTFCKTLSKDPAKYGLPSMLGANRTSYSVWRYKKITIECCELFFYKPYHPRCSVALRWPNVRVQKIGLIAAGYSPVKVFGSAYRADVPVTNSEYMRILDVINRLTESSYALEERLLWEPAWFLVWEHIPNISSYYRPRSRKIIDYLIRHKGYFNDYGVNRIDEIFDNDITHISLKPEHLFGRKDELKRLEEDRKNPLVKFPRFPYTLIDKIEHIDDSSKLNAEGIRMHHCVFNYSGACQRGETFILKLPNSTAEINISGFVSQHRGIYNRPPPAEDLDLLQKWKHERRRLETATDVLERTK